MIIVNGKARKNKDNTKALEIAKRQTPQQLLAASYPRIGVSCDITRQRPGGGFCSSCVRLDSQCDASSINDQPSI